MNELTRLVKLAGLREGFADDAIGLNREVAQLKGRIDRSKELAYPTDELEPKLARREAALEREKIDMAMPEGNDYGHRDDTNSTELTRYGVRDYDYAGRANYPNKLVNRQGDNPMDEPVEEDAANDYGHRDDTNSTELTRYGVRDYDFAGRANYPNDLVNRQGDNPMQDEVDEGLDECGCSDETQEEVNPQLEALHIMLSKVGVPDDAIANGSVQLTASGRSKISAKLGDVNVDVLLSRLAEKLNGDQDALAQDYHATVNAPIEMAEEGFDDEEDDEEPDDRWDRVDTVDCPYCGGEGHAIGSLGNRQHFRCRNCGADFSTDFSHQNPQQEGLDEETVDESPYDFDGATAEPEQPEPETDERFAHESDYMGNVTVRDTQSGKEVYLQGSEGHRLIAELEAAEPDQRKVQELLSQYEEVMTPPARMDGMGEAVSEGEGMNNFIDNFSEDEDADFESLPPVMIVFDRDHHQRASAFYLRVQKGNAVKMYDLDQTLPRAAHAAVKLGFKPTHLVDGGHISPLPSAIQAIVDRGMAAGNNAPVEENEMGELIGEDGGDYIEATLERPAPGSADDWEDRKVKVYYEIDAGSRGARGEFGRPMEPDEGPSCGIIKVVDAETGQEYQIDAKERAYLEELCQRDRSEEF